jgi:hypothetical protein
MLLLFAVSPGMRCLKIRHGSRSTMAALVEQAAAAAKSLEEHAVALRDAVSVFQLDATAA